MQQSDVFLTRVHVEELLTTTHAIRQWLRSNEPVRAYEALGKLDEKINTIVKALENDDLK